MHKTFGIAYIAIRALLCGVVILFVLFAAGILADQLGGEAGAIVGMIALIFVVWLGYSVAGGVLAIKGHVAGPIMGLVDTGLSSLLFIGTLFQDGNVVGTMCWVVPNIALIVLAIFALKERSQVAQPGYGMTGYGNPQGGYGNPQYAPQSGYANPQYAPQSGYANPQYAPQSGYAAPSPQPAQAPRPVGGAAAPSPKQAALGILALAASVDPDLTQDALQRARAVAAKLLGPAAQARIQRQLAQPVEVLDVDADLWQHVAVLNQDGNPQMKANIIKAVEYVLKGPNGIEPLGEQFIATLKHQLGS
ncbi:MAG: hypothetical protein K8I27_12650 [Planctomycetes bacterium]|nr:hypothetical protein [Planctomycetota bacterium]